MIRAIDELGVTVDYVQATHFHADYSQGITELRDSNGIVAIVPITWIIRILDQVQADPGVEARE